MDKNREMSESGMLVYPKLPVPKQRESHPSMPRRSGGGIGVRNVLLLFVVGILGGAVGGFFLRPMILEDQRLVDAEKALATEKLAHAESRAAIAKHAEETKKLDEQRELLNQQLEAARQAQEMVAGKAEDQAKQKADLEVVKKKLEGAGAVTLDGTELRLVIGAGNLFKSGDELGPGGARLLDKVATVLKDHPDKLVAVHGHTDDTPPPKPKAPPPPKKDKKNPAPPPPAPPEPEFATNWELSSARSLAVVHYFQDKHKIEATRLSSSAFSQYRPISKSNKAANRRIELVFSTRPAKK